MWLAHWQTSKTTLYRIGCPISKIKQRAKLLKDNVNDINWIETLEKQLSELSVSICSSRLDLLNRLSYHLQNSVVSFPKLEVGFIDSIETELTQKPAIDVEDNLKEKLSANRETDRLLGGSRVGCHKTDLVVKNLQKNLILKTLLIVKIS